MTSSTSALPDRGVYHGGLLIKMGLIEDLYSSSPIVKNSIAKEDEALFETTVFTVLMHLLTLEYVSEDYTDMVLTAQSITDFSNNELEARVIGSCVDDGPVPAYQHLFYTLQEAPFRLRRPAYELARAMASHVKDQDGVTTEISLLWIITVLVTRHAHATGTHRAVRALYTAMALVKSIDMVIRMTQVEEDLPSVHHQEFTLLSELLDPSERVTVNDLTRLQLEIGAEVSTTGDLIGAMSALGDQYLDALRIVFGGLYYNAGPADAPIGYYPSDAVVANAVAYCTQLGYGFINRFSVGGN